MSKDPAFLFYSSDFLNGVSDLTMEERGQYITLLCLQHQKDELTEKTIRLSLGSVSVDVLAKFEKLENGNYKNKRLIIEIEKRVNFTESRRNNGAKGGRPKKESKPLGYPKENLMENENENENEDVNKVEVKIDFKSILIDHGFEKTLIDEWFAVRRNKNVTDSKTFFSKFIKEVESTGEDVNLILKTCVENSWAGFKLEYWTNYKKNNNGAKQRNNNTERTDADHKQSAVDAVNAMLGIQ